MSKYYYLSIIMFFSLISEAQFFSVKLSGENLTCERIYKDNIKNNSLFCSKGKSKYLIKDFEYTFTGYKIDEKNEVSQLPVPEVQKNGELIFKNQYELSPNYEPQTVSAKKLFNENVSSELSQLDKSAMKVEWLEEIKKFESQCKDNAKKLSDILSESNKVVVEYKSKKINCSKSFRKEDELCPLLICENVKNNNGTESVIVAQTSEGLYKLNFIVGDNIELYEQYEIFVNSKKFKEKHLLFKTMKQDKDSKTNSKEFLFDSFGEQEFKTLEVLCKGDDTKKIVNKYKQAREKTRKEIMKQELVQVANESYGVVTSKFIDKNLLSPGACEENKVADKYKPSKLDPLTLDEANKIFEEVKNMKDIAFKHLPDGCVERAIIISERLKDRGIKTNKAWLTGNLGPKNLNNPWSKHVAPYFEVKVGNKVEKMIIDPAVSDKLISFQEWKNIVKRDNPGGEIETFFPPPGNASGFGKMTVSFSNSEITTDIRTFLPGTSYEERYKSALKTNAEYLNKTSNNQVIVNN